ncbi:MORC family CW-type zinc finger protein 3 [Bienertia sinuspersici]
MKDLNVKCLSKVDSRKRDLNATKSSSKEDASSCYVKLMKDDKIICRTKCTNPPIQPSSFWNVDIVKKTRVKGLYDLPQFLLFPAFEDPRQKSEWIKFLTFLCMNNRMKAYILRIAVVAYELQEVCDTSVDQRHATSAAVRLENGGKELPQLHSVPQTPCINDAPAFDSVTCAKRSSSAEKGTCSSISKCHEAVNSLHPFCAKDDVAAERNFVRADPSYLKTLGQAHSVGSLVQLQSLLIIQGMQVHLGQLAIAIETIYAKTVGAEIPMLSITDDGIGMNHEEILRMISFGHKQPDEDNLDRIGGLVLGSSENDKTGSMKLGRDALVLTQTSHSRSIAFLSQSLNEGKDNLEIPVVSYRRQAQCMEIDTSAQSEALARYNLNAIKEFSPFDEYLIGEKAGLFEGKTGTQIYIWNLDKWGSDYTLEWQEGMRGGSSFHQGDILIRSRRVRSRPGQISRKVHLDYSLRSYLEVIFLEPRMKIFVQGSLVRSRPLAKSLNKTTVINDEVMGKQLQLTLGRSQVEWDEANCGIFLYWHGRLIEAYKRVGGMIHSADMGRGVIGVIDVTEVMIVACGVALDEFKGRLPTYSGET